MDDVCPTPEELSELSDESAGLDAEARDELNEFFDELSETSERNLRHRFWFYTVCVGLFLGALVFFLFFRSPAAQCVTDSLAPVECSDPSAAAQLLASGDLESSQNVLARAVEICPGTTGELAVSDDELHCLGAPDGSSWVGHTAPALGDCVALTGRLGPPPTVPCSEPLSDGALALVVESLDIRAPAFDSPADALDAYQSHVGNACSIGSPVGPSFFEWRAGAARLICLVAAR